MRGTRVAIPLAMTAAALFALSACGAFGQCVCGDGYPPTWSGFIDLPDADAGQLQCVATMTRGDKVIELDIGFGDEPNVCTKTGGADGGLCAYNSTSPCPAFDGAACSGPYTELSIDLVPEDESYLGGFDFDLSVSCNGTVIRQSHEVFITRKCEC